MGNQKISFDVNMGYQKPNFEDHGAGANYSAKDLQREPIWSSHYDEDSGSIYYYNRLTRASQWERPAKFDGYEIMTG